MTNTTNVPRLEPIKRISDRSGIPYTSLRDAHFRGELPIVKVGKAWYVDVADFARWVEAQKERA